MGISSFSHKKKNKLANICTKKVKHLKVIQVIQLNKCIYLK